MWFPPFSSSNYCKFTKAAIDITGFVPAPDLNYESQIMPAIGAENCYRNDGFATTAGGRSTDCSVVADVGVGSCTPDQRNN